MNPRTRFDHEELETLAASLRTTEGVVHPLAVQQSGEESYVLIVAALAENLIRVDLDPMR